MDLAVRPRGTAQKSSREVIHEPPWCEYVSYAGAAKLPEVNDEANDREDTDLHKHLSLLRS